MKIKTTVKITDKNAEPFMGPGPFQLLVEIKKQQSINRAAKSMNLSYVKALKILDRLEEKTGKTVLSRKKGGKERGGAELTEFGEKLVTEYENLKNNIIEHANNIFADFHKNLFPDTEQNNK